MVTVVFKKTSPKPLFFPQRNQIYEKGKKYPPPAIKRPLSPHLVGATSTKKATAAHPTRHARRMK